VYTEETRRETGVDGKRRGKTRGTPRGKTKQTERKWGREVRERSGRSDLAGLKEREEGGRNNGMKPRCSIVL